MTVRRLATRAMLLLLLGAVLVDPARAGHVPPDSYPPAVSGVTTLVAESSGGVRLRIPRQTVLAEEDFKIVPDATTDFAFVAVRPDPCPDPDVLGVCFSWRAHYIRGTFQEVWRFTPSPGLVRPGHADVYVVSDGPVTVEMTFQGLEGESTVNVLGDVDAKLQKLTPQCPATDCTNVAYAGAAHRLGTLGYASSIAFSHIPSHAGPGVPNRGVAGASSCLYPSPLNPDGSPDPEDHPYGCDNVSTTNTNQEAARTVDFVVRGVVQGNIEVGTFAYSMNQSGDQYAGYQAAQATAIEGGWHVGYGLWINPGIVCDSSCQHDTFANDEA